MLLDSLLVAHIAVLGYWLGSELVINSTYRYVSYHGEMPFAHRDRLMAHVMNVDQHVRYALVLQAGLGTTLGLRLGYLPGGEGLAVVAGVITVAWLVFVEAVHRLRQAAIGARLGAVDRGIRYALMALLVGIWSMAIAGNLDLQPWLAWKLLCFAGVMACGVGIRLWIMKFFRVWKEVEHEGSSAAQEQLIQKIYVRSTSVLVGLWLFIGAIVILSVWKPS